MRHVDSFFPQYAHSFFEADDGTKSMSGEFASSNSAGHHSAAGYSAGGAVRRSQSNWSNAFDEDLQSVRRRLWCRIMCPAQYKDKALAACERYLLRKNRGEILNSPDIYVEIDGCCSSKFKLQRVVLKDNTVEYFSGQKRTGVFPISPLTRVRLQDSRVADKKEHPLVLRIEDVGDHTRNADYITLAMKRDTLRELW